MIPDSQHPFFRPLWRRVAVVTACLFWAALEFIAGETVWGVVALALAAYGVWHFFFRYMPPPGEPDNKE